MYDYLIVGAGLFGATFAREATDRGYSCLVIDRRNHIAGNAYCEDVCGIPVHAYGAHIFHTSDKKIWEYVNRFAEFNNYINSPVAVWKDELYNLPFNMNTFSKMWNIKTPAEAKAIIEKQKAEARYEEPKNLEEQAISLVGHDIYEKLVKGYTEKQWGRDCKDLPAFIIKRLPVRFTYDNNYFNDRYQGIPERGYTDMVANMLKGIEVRTGTDYLKERETFRGLAKKVMGDVIAHARATGKKAVRLDAIEGNLPAHRLYESLGFQMRGVRNWYVANLGYIDFYLYEYLV